MRILIALLLLNLPLVAKGQAFEETFELKLVEKGSSLEFFGLDKFTPTEVTLHVAPNEKLKYSLKAGEVHMGDFHLSHPASNEVVNGVKVISFNISLADIRAGSKPGSRVPYNGFLFIDFKIPEGKPGFVERLKNHAVYDGRDVVGEFIFGDDRFLALRKSDWGGKDDPHRNIKPSPTPCKGPLERIFR